jgi:hypothetical protein
MLVDRTVAKWCAIRLIVIAAAVAMAILATAWALRTKTEEFEWGPIDHDMVIADFRVVIVHADDAEAAP